MANIIIKRLKDNIPIPMFFIFIFSVSFFALSTASSAQDEVLKIQNVYENIEDISGNFIQKSYIKDLNRTDTFKGQLFIKMPAKMKWVYKEEDPQEILINNDEIIIYKKKEKQAFKGNFNRETYGQAPIALLSGFGKIQEEFIISKKNNKLLLKPKKQTGNIVSIEIAYSERGFPISSFAIYDSYSNRIEITLKDVRINTGIKDSFFEFKIPEDTRVFEYNP